MKKIIIFAISLVLIPGVFADSLWKNSSLDSSSASLCKDDRAGKVGDMLTILVVESANATQKADSAQKRETSIDMTVKTWKMPNFNNILRPTTTVSDPKKLPAAQIDAKNDWKGSGSFSGNYAVRGQITTRVIDILPNGNLMIEGSTFVRINEETNNLAVSGIVRPQDITPNNTVLSTQVAELKYQMMGKGPINDKTKRGLLSRAFDFLWPF